jgi:putative ABC transport system permease protein
VETNLKVVNIAPVDKLVQFSTGSGGTSPEAFALGHVMEALKNIPGVSQVSYVSNAPFSDTSTATQKMQRSDDAGSAPRTVGSISITPGYFKTVGTRILAGSDYSIDQSAGQGSEIIVNALLVKELFARESPIGKGVKISVPAWSGMTAFSYRATIIGVVENSRQFGLASSPQLTFYTSIIGTPFMDVRPQLVVSGIVSEGELRAAASRIVPGFMSGMGVSDVYGVAPLITTALAPEVQRVYWALGGAVIMSVMAYTGLLGALAYYVRSKQRDLAVRICLGANPRSIRTIVVIRALKCTLPASLLAIPFALMLRQLSSTDLLGQSAWSTPQAVSIAVTCVFVSGIVSVIPARAATRISPAEILKT